MSMTSAEKAKIVSDFKQSSNDTGSTEVQVSLMSARIAELTEHFKVHKKDHHSRYGLQTLVNKRRKLLKYLKTRSSDRYRSLIQALGLRDSY